MSTDRAIWTRLSQSTLSREALALTAAAAIAIGYAGSIFMAFASHIWLVDTHGRPVPFDFVAYWSAGRLALTGNALSVFDPRLQHAAEVATVGHDFSNILGWSYPPLFLFVAILLACLPYLAAFVVWICATLAAYGSVVAWVSARRSAWLLALTPPWVFFGILNGQNGFLSAAIAGTVLMTLERQPVLSGMVLGLLSFKPQLAILFPIAIAAGGYWRTFFWASVGTALWTTISCTVFGPGTAYAFIGSLMTAAQTHLAAGGVRPENLQSIYGLCRWLGAAETNAMALQTGFTIICAILVGALWRSGCSFALKAAGLAAALPLATPYIYISDIAVLSVSIAFLYRDRKFASEEIAVLAFALLAAGGFVLVAYPAGLLASLAVEALVILRYWPGIQSKSGYEGAPRTPQPQHTTAELQA